MGDPLGTWSHEFVVRLGCPNREGEQKCSIPLPRQSLLGIYEGLKYRPTGEWPETFLCVRHARVFVCSIDSVDLDLEMRGLDELVSPMWRIECQCAHENCGRLHTIYTGRMPDWPSIVRRILKTNPSVPCSDHDLVWREDLMRATEIAHDSPMRYYAL